MEGESARRVPAVPPPGRPIATLIDTDAANEIDDLYAIALAIRSPERLKPVGFVATHFAAKGGPETTRMSFDAIAEVLAVAHADYPVTMGGDPMSYPGVPQSSDGAEFIIENAKKAHPEEPLLVLVLGAASNTASALLQAPEIADRITVMFHGRSEDTWPERSTQFNICGDIIAVRTLLESRAPLIWFDTGTRLCASMEVTERELLPHGELGRFLHEYRYREPWYQRDTKGFFDLGDVAWLIDPALCVSEVIEAPTLTRWMYFDHDHTHGRMLRVSDIDVENTWKLFFNVLRATA